MSVVPDSIWDISNPTMPLNDGTVDYEMLAYENHGADVTGRTDYRLWSTDTESFYIPSSARLEVHFKLTTAANGSYTFNAPDQRPALASNGYCLFEDARLRVQDVEIAHVQKPGRVAHANNLLMADREWVQSIGENAHYFLDDVSDLHDAANMIHTAPIVSSLAAAVSGTGQYFKTLSNNTSAAVGTGVNAVPAFTSALANERFDETFKRKVDRQLSLPATGFQVLQLPLKDIFPVLNTNRVIKGSKLEFELNKINNVKEALYGDSGDDTKIVIGRIRLWIARVKPSFSVLASVNEALKATPKVEHVYENMKLYTYPYSDASSGEKVWQLVHRQNKPTKVAVWFQFNARYVTAELNPLKFDLLGAGDASVINRLELRHNGKQVPNVVYDPQADYTRILEEIYRVSNVDKENSHCINHKNWKSMFPIFIFDTSQLDGSAYESRTQSVLELMWTLSATTDAGLYTVNALVYSEMKAVYNYSDGITTLRSS